MNLKYFEALDHIQKKGDPELLELMKQANIVLFNTQMSNETYLKHDSRLIEPLETEEEKVAVLKAIPFDVVWYESTQGSLYKDDLPGYPEWELQLNGLLITDQPNTSLGVAVVAFKHKTRPNLVDESIVDIISLESFKYLVEQFDQKLAKHGIAGKELGYKFHTPTTLKVFAITVLAILNIAITEGRSFTETTRMRHKVKANGKKEFITVRKMVYIGGRKQDVYTTPSGKQIEYSHRFEIRGHWRTLTYGKVGKDRNGNYCVKEKTWVRPYEKGEKDAPLIKKTRVISSDLIIG